MVRNRLPHDKFKIFENLFRYPLRTNEVTSICFDKLSRIFDGRNPAFNYQFLNSEQRDDWEYYRQDVLHEPEVWSKKGWEFFKTEIIARLSDQLGKKDHWMALLSGASNPPNVLSPMKRDRIGIG